MGNNLPAAESPELDPRVSVGNNLPAANSPDPDLRVESRVEDLEEPCVTAQKDMLLFIRSGIRIAGFYSPLLL